MRTSFTLAAWAIAAAGHSQGLGVPQPEAVYGGLMLNAVSMALHADTTRVFVATESANSIFYADLYLPDAGMPGFVNFQPVPGADEDNSLGAAVGNIAAHAASRSVFFAIPSGIFRADHQLTAPVLTVSPPVNSLAIYGDILFYVEGGNLHWGSLSATGSFTEDAASPLAVSPPPSQLIKVIVSPTDHRLWWWEEGTAPALYFSSDSVENFSSSTSFSSVSLASVTDPEENWRAFGVAPSGRLLITGNHYPAGSYVSDHQTLAYSDNMGLTWTQYNKPVMGPFAGVVGPDFAFVGNSAGYTALNGDTYSTDVATSSTWLTIGSAFMSSSNRPNSGFVHLVTQTDSMVIFTTNQGLGISYNGGPVIGGANEGLLAVQVNDLDMTSNYNNAWVASKSGIRHVTGYSGSSPAWGATDFPMDDGSPYHSVEIAGDDSNTVYVGNVRLYKTSNGGGSWNQLLDPTLASGPYNFQPFGCWAEALDVMDEDPDIVLAGFANENNTYYGGLFASNDAGANWSQVLVEATTWGEDIDVYDVVLRIEGPDTVAYVGAGYELGSPQGRSVYRVVKSGGVWTATQDMDAAGTVAGYPITANIYDLDLSKGGDTLFACGTDAGLNHPIVYYKDFNGSNLWNTLTTSGFPTGTNDVASAVTNGGGYVFCAVNADIYAYPMSGGSWSLAYSYPAGTRINVLFYDELLAGTGTGLYAFEVPTNFGIREPDANREMLRFYPNPAAEHIDLAVRADRQGRLSYRFLDLQGRPVYEGLADVSVGEQNVRIRWKNLPPGTYVLETVLFDKTERGKLVIR